MGGQGSFSRGGRLRFGQRRTFFRHKLHGARWPERVLPASPPPPLCDIPSGRCSFTGPWTVTRSSLRMLRRVAAFCRPLRPVLLRVSFPRSRSPVVGVPGLCWMWRDVPFARQRRPVVGVLAPPSPPLSPRPRPLSCPSASTVTQTVGPHSGFFPNGLGNFLLLCT